MFRRALRLRCPRCGTSAFDFYFAMKEHCPRLWSAIRTGAGLLGRRGRRQYDGGVRHLPGDLGWSNSARRADGRYCPAMRRPPFSGQLVLLALAVPLASCNGGSTAVFDATTTASAPATTVSSTTTSLPADAAPPEMRGTWRAEITPDDVVFLTLNPVNYSVTRGSNSAGGQISVEGDLIRLFDGSACPDEGFYTWAREGDNLTFAGAEGGDPCGGRRPILDGVTYELVSAG